MLQSYLAERPSRGDVWSRSDVDGCGDRLPDASNAAGWIRCVGQRHSQAPRSRVHGALRVRKLTRGMASAPGPAMGGGAGAFLLVLSAAPTPPLSPSSVGGRWRARLHVSSPQPWLGGAVLAGDQNASRPPPRPRPGRGLASHPSSRIDTSRRRWTSLARYRRCPPGVLMQESCRSGPNG